MARADKRTQRAAVEELYSDVPINFDKNPITGNLSRVTNEESVRASIRQIILSMRGEWPHCPELGSFVYRALFEPIDMLTAETIRTFIGQALSLNEPRARVARIDVIPEVQENGYRITVWFYLINSDEPIKVEALLKRVR